MRLENKVIWFEGMFLQPQHFQQHDRYIENLVHAKQLAVDHNVWGFSELTLDLSMINLGKIGITSAKGLFSDGTPFDIPRMTMAPRMIEIPAGLNDSTLYLAIPAKQEGVAEIGEPDCNQLYRYKVLDREVADHTANSEAATQVQVGSLECRILSDHDDRQGYVCLPITRVIESRANHKVTFDEGFLTSYLNVHAAPALKNLMREIHGLLSHRADMLAGRLTDTQQAGTAEIVDFMLLQLVNRYEPVFHYLMNKMTLHPEKLFYILIQLMSEMATFTNNRRRPIEPPVYHHDDLFNTFQPVIKELRYALTMVLEQNATAIPLESRSHGVWIGQINDKEMIKNSHFILAVYADMPADQLRVDLVKQIKISPVEQIRNLVNRALPGVDVSPIAVAPRQIPYHANFSYFALNMQHELWQHMLNSAGIAIHAGLQYPNLKLELWAIKG